MSQPGDVIRRLRIPCIVCICCPHWYHGHKPKSNEKSEYLSSRQFGTPDTCDMLRFVSLAARWQPDTQGAAAHDAFTRPLARRSSDPEGDMRFGLALSDEAQKQLNLFRGWGAQFWRSLGEGIAGERVPKRQIGTASLHEVADERILDSFPFASECHGDCSSAGGTRTQMRFKGNSA